MLRSQCEENNETMQDVLGQFLELNIIKDEDEKGETKEHDTNSSSHFKIMSTGIPVITFDLAIKQQVVEECLEARHVGLTCICLSNNLDDKLLLVCLTTEFKIFVFQTKKEDDIEMLKIIFHQLKDDLAFYVLQGQHVSSSLKRRGIILDNNVIDLTTFDLFYRMREMAVCGSSPQPEVFSMNYLVDNAGLSIRKRVELASFWLGVNLDVCSQEEKFAMKEERPFNELAKMGIRNHAALTRAIGLEIQRRFDKMLDMETNSIFSFGIEADASVINNLEQNEANSFSVLTRELDQIRSNKDSNY